MTIDMEIRRRTWNAAIRLGVLCSMAGVVLVIIASALTTVPQSAVILPMIVAAFVTSWLQTERIRRDVIAAHTAPALRSHVRATPVTGSLS